MFARAFIENGIIQIEINKEFNSEFVFCGGMGCFLRFKYQILADIISFTGYYIFGKTILKLNKKSSIIAAIIFVCVFMLTGLYHDLGGLTYNFINDILLPNTASNLGLFWAVILFIGILFSFLIMTLGIKLVRKLVP
tara:strand:+ start:37808 stop:38218 length:411 start_codon:yes stop_codon:yes gene_type:complete